MKLMAHSRIALTLAAGGGAVSAGALSSSPGAAAGAPRLLAETRGPSCPVPVGKQVQAVKVFESMLPVFRHPRCTNCHGGMNVFDDSRHPGASGLDEELDPRSRLHDDAFKEAFTAQCTDCHDGLPGWTVPPPGQFFHDRSDEALCKQMKMSNSTPERYVGHIRNDHEGIQFIAAGFKGDRALGEDGLKEIHKKAEPPPGTQLELTDKAQRYVDLLGKNGYSASSECGCVMPGIKLEVHHTQLTEGTGGPGWREYSEAKFEVRLPPAGGDRSDVFAAEHSLTRPIQMTVPRPCTANASRDETWEFTATVDEKTGVVRVRRSMAADEPVGKVVCRYPQGTGEMEMFPSSEGVLAYGELSFPPDSAASRTLKYEMDGYKETLRITVLEVPGR